MKCSILSAILLVSIFLGDTFATEETRASKKCNKPFGKIGESHMDPDCGQSVCRKEGFKPKWKKCPRAATEESMKAELGANLGKTEQLMKEQTAATEEAMKAEMNATLGKTEQRLQENIAASEVSMKAELGKIEQLIKNQTENMERLFVDVCGMPGSTIIPGTTLLSTARPELPVVFQKSAQFAIVRDNFIDTLSNLGREYFIEFQVYLTTIISGWAQIIDFVDNEPVLWYHGGSEIFQIQSVINGGVTAASPEYKMVVDTWYNFQISQLENDEGQYEFQFKVNGATLWTITNTTPAKRQNVKVGVCGNYAAADGFMRNLVVKTKDD